MYLPEMKLVMEPTELLYNEITITCSSDSAKVLRENCFPVDEICLRERFVMISLNRKNAIIGFYLVSIGGRSSTTADISLILSAAAKSNASAIIIAHNHPSGNLKPSPADIKLTESVQKCLAYCDIQVLDHIILTEKSYYSFADENQLS